MQRPCAIGLFLLTACASGPALHNEDGREAERLEIAMDSMGHPREIEYHIQPEAVPAAVHAAMETLHPGGRMTTAEKEYLGVDLYWELAKEIDGFAVEAMFRPDGTLHSQEVEVAASTVPESVKSAVARAGYGDVRVWEEIHDGMQQLVEYHAKTTRDGRNYKLLVGVDGQLLSVYREIEAEIEIPVE